MEKIQGVALSETWEAMNNLERYRIIDQIVQVEKELANISFPAYGGLFLRESLPATYRQFSLPPQLDPEGLFCIGPSCKRTWWHDDFVDKCHPVVKDVGPCEYFWIRNITSVTDIIQGRNFRNTRYQLYNESLLTLREQELRYNVNSINLTSLSRSMNIKIFWKR